jgi:autotransporter-associated beta strand protein/probable HAF family extracellular repeat protein
LGFLPGFDYSEAVGVSADGTRVVGNIRPIGNNSNGSSQAFSWTASVMIGLGYLPGQDMSRALGVSADGSTVAGYGQLLNSGTGALAFRWTPSTALVALGNLPGGPNDNFATAASADGSVIVGGAAAAGCCGAQAFRWTATTGMIGLNNLPGATGAVANSVSADGSVVVGYSSNNQAFRWTATTGSVGLGFLPGSISSQAIAVSANGAVVTGVSLDSTTRDQAFRWTTTTGMVAIGSLSGAIFTTPRALNADGSVIVGTSGSGVNFQPFRWTQTTGMQSIRDTLIAGGYGPAGWTLQTANGVSADGTVIAGNGIDPDGKNEAWIARIPVNAFALLDLKGVDLSIGSLVWGGVVTNSGPGTATLRAGSDNSSTNFIGTIADGAGTTALIKEGTGTLTLSGANTYTGPTFVNAGTLSVNGSIASSSLTTVNAGATLGGNGTVGNTTVNGGTLAPGNSIGLLTVQGNLVFTAASSYMVEVSPSNADRTNVSGAATLGSATVSANFGAGTYVAKQYTIVSASGGVIGTFASLVNTNLPSGFNVSRIFRSIC